MRSILGVPILVIAAALAYGGDLPEPTAEENDSVGAEAPDLKESTSNLARIEGTLGHAFSPPREMAQMPQAGASSRMVLGLSQLLNGDTTVVLLLTGDLLVMAGTLVATSFLPILDLQIPGLGSFTAPTSTIRNTSTARFQPQALLQALPALVVVEGGMVLHYVLSGVATRHAPRLVPGRIDRGEVVLEPHVSFLDGRLSVGFGIGFELGRR